MRVRYCSFSVRWLLPALMLLSSTVHAELRISEAWVRAVPPVSSGTAGYFLLENTGPAAETLTGVQATFARHVMMHSMARNDAGLREMKHVGSLTIAPGDSARFESGGMHLMIMGLESVPASGDTVEICFLRAAGEPLCHDFEVRRERP